jgi:hypothetical protein
VAEYLPRSRPPRLKILISTARDVLQVAGFQPRMFRDARQHLWPNLVIVMKGKYIVVKAGLGKYAMRALGSFYLPADGEQSAQ